MMRCERVAVRAWFVPAAALVLLACRGGSRAAEPSVEEAVLISPANIVVVDSTVLASGPTVSGSLQPDRAASIRAEIGGSVVEIAAEPGQRVARGALLGRIDDSAIRDAWLSARSGATAAEQATVVAERDLERAERLAEAGAIAERDLEAARIAVSSSRARLADAQARLAQAEKQLASTRVTSPIGGVVSERAVRAGDVVSPGMLLFTVVDPASLRLEAAVPAARLGSIRMGAPVEFTVTGYGDRTFTGRIDRIQPTVDPATGQVSISAMLPNPDGTIVGGVFAEGRVGSESRSTLAAPFAAVVVTGEASAVLRVRGGVVERIDVRLGLRDEQAELIEIVSGILAGDTLLLGAAQGITPGTPVRVQSLADRGPGE